MEWEEEEEEEGTFVSRSGMRRGNTKPLLWPFLSLLLLVFTYCTSLAQPTWHIPLPHINS